MTNFALKSQKQNKKDILYRIKRISNKYIEVEIFDKKIKLPKSSLENIIYTSFIEDGQKLKRK